MKKQSIVNRSVVLGAVLGAFTVLVIGFGPALAQNKGGAGGGAGGGGKAAVVATVRLSVVMEKLDQRADAQANLSQFGAGIQNEDKTRKDEIQKMQDQLNQMLKANGNAAPTREMTDLQEQATLKGLKYQAWSHFTLEKVDIEKALLWEDLYRSIKQAAASMATANGYDLVLVDDSQGETGTNPDSRASRESQIMTQIGGRRTLYANPALDITDELITRMNNAHKAAGAAAPAPAPVPAPAGGGAGKPN